MADILAELFAVHLPIWGCVAAFHVVLLELFRIQLGRSCSRNSWWWMKMNSAFYFYYHEETMVYSAMALAFSFGVFHELKGGWLSNDILAFSSVYVLVARCQAIGLNWTVIHEFVYSFQPVSYQAGVILSAGMALFDLFFIYAVDLLSQSALHALCLHSFIQPVCSGTVTSESHSPIMITIPSYGENGGKQSLATLDIIVPGGSKIY